VGAQILGQQVLVDRLLVAMLADGHLLVEGAPGLAKTSAIKALAGVSRRTSIASSSRRICCRLT
jgi:MoxR-like ATPase